MINRKAIATLLFVLMATFATVVIAKSTFLPDWQENFLEKDGGHDLSLDENLCATAEKMDGTLMYHKAFDCEMPKIFDEVCIYHDEWISECYCPEQYNLDCKAPLRGNSLYSCDGKWSSCCDTTCPAGTSSNNPGGCGGSTTNNCGDRCYYPYQSCCSPLGSETGCACGTYTCDDGCGGSRSCCSTCQDDNSGDDGSSGSSNSAGSSNSSGSSNSDSNGGGTGGTKCSDYKDPYGDPMLATKPNPVYWDCKIGTASPAVGLTCYYKDGCVQKPSVCPGLGYSNTFTQGCSTVWLDYAGFACFDCSGNTGTKKCSDFPGTGGKGLTDVKPTYWNCKTVTPATGLSCYDLGDCVGKPCKEINASYSDTNTGSCTQVKITDGLYCYNCVTETCKYTHTRGNCKYPVGTKCTTLTGEERWSGCDTCAENYPGYTYYCSAPNTGDYGNYDWWSSCTYVRVCSHGGVYKPCIQQSGTTKTTSSPYVCIK